MTRHSILLQLLPEPPESVWQPGCLGLGAGALFVSLAIGVTGHEPGSTDRTIHAWAVANRGDASSAIGRVIARTGSSRATLPALVLVGAVAPDGRRSVRLRLASGLLLAGVTGLGIAGRIGINARTARRRPEPTDWVGHAGGSAFPSGHTTSATLFAAACAWALAPRFRGGAPRAVLWAAAGGFALAVGWSRVWVGVHWPSDVLGGWLYALAWSALAVTWVGWRRQVTRSARSQPPETTSGPVLRPAVPG
jgi:membrane-associated phospholipid phosphatase